MNAKRLISIVVPFYNEEAAIAAFYATLRAVLEKIEDIDFEIICIDDGSSDTTLGKLKELHRQDSRFEVISFSRNFGKEAALTAGLDAARGDALIPMDADLQDPPELLLKMIKAWEGGAEVVLARRSDRSSDTFLKRKTAELFYRVHNKLSDVSIPENVGDFRLIDRIVIEALKELPERQRFMKGLFAWVGFRTTVVDYERQPRTAGVSKFSGWRLWNFAIEGITSFSAVPLKFWSYLGGLGAIFTSGYAAFIVLRTLVHGVDIPGYASLLVAILFFGSVQLIGIGVLGEYIGRIYMETKKRPLYLIRERYGASK